ncbi:hypothetical protein J2S07_002987 [Robertmurraya andreesenii]|uniref:Uncharacterized protein n=1 Tax=Anoxybacillus andreesenii TaxID=1325932 RepID=A0ABT9V6T6_9BACL|nr:hypothetical protein [Robertmurraya andreesenii]
MKPQQPANICKVLIPASFLVKTWQIRRTAYLADKSLLLIRRLLFFSLGSCFIALYVNIL